VDSFQAAAVKKRRPGTGNPQEQLPSPESLSRFIGRPGMGKSTVRSQDKIIDNSWICNKITVYLLIMWENIQIKRFIGKLLPSDDERILILLTGARQTGKTTLLKLTYPGLAYFNLDAIEYREQLRQLSTFSWGRDVGNAVLDEIQKEPGLFDKIKYAFDEGNIRFSALSGSAQLLLMKKVKETLAGRVRVFELFPLMLSELVYYAEDNIPVLLIDELLQCKEASLVFEKRASVLLGDKWNKLVETEEYLIKWGGMPALTAIRDESEKRAWLRDYSLTYLERDLSDLARLNDLMPFRKFQQLAALRTSNLLAYSELARDAGIGIETARRYLEYLRLSYQTILLPPYQKNLTSRLIKTPKLFWLDNGLARHLSGLGFDIINGQLYENYVASELFKYFRSSQKPEMLSFYRTRSGMEVDFCIETGGGLMGIEVKNRQTINKTDYSSLRRLQEVSGQNWLCGLLVYKGNQIVRLDEKLWAVPSCRLFS
jgi:predicted AAA+ superfamily ATPase